MSDMPAATSRTMKSEYSFDMSQRQVLRILKMYKEADLLWDKSHPENKIRFARERKLDAMVQKLNIPDFGKKHLKLKIRTYRDMYFREVKRKNSGSTRKPFWFNAMTFLNENQKEEMTTNDSNNENGDNDNPDIENGDNDASEDSDQIHFSYKTENEEMDEQEMDVQSDSAYYFTDTAQSENFLNNDHLANASEEIKDSVKALSQQQTEMWNLLQKNDTNDCYDTFAKYIATMLRALPKRNALALQPKIVELLTQEQIAVDKETECTINN